MRHIYSRLGDGGGTMPRPRPPGGHPRHEATRLRQIGARVQGSGAGRAIDGEASHG
jgi:hypothetical protein